jgi:RNA polymerase sigma-70 factor (ECF subfamily)
VAALQIADPAPSAERRLAARQEYRVLRDALNALPQNQRAALLWNRVECLTHAEIAVRLGVSPSMVNKYIMRALAHCATSLAKAGF